MKHEYHEGQHAADRFEKLATTLFQTPKTVVKKVDKPKRTPKKTSKG